MKGLSKECGQAVRVPWTTYSRDPSIADSINRFTKRLDRLPRSRKRPVAGRNGCRVPHGLG